MIEPGSTKSDSLTREAKTAGDRGAATMTSRVDWYNLLLLFLSTVAVSGIVSLYVVFLAWLNLKKPDADPLERAAVAAASDMVKINVTSKSFGTLGIADFCNNDNSYGGQNDSDPQVRSFNTVYSLLRTSLFLAQKYKLTVLGTQATADLHQLQTLQNELRATIACAIKDDGTGKIYQHVKRILAGNRRGGEKLESLQIKLGYIKNDLSSSQILPETDDEQKNISNGRLKTLTPLAVPGTDDTIVLHQQTNSSAIVNPNNFSVDPTSKAIPTALLIEAQFSKAGQPAGKRKICVIAGAGKSSGRMPGQIAPEGGCLAVSFPQGRPSFFSSVESILLYRGWQSRGEWQQAVQGNVPGQGQLAPSAAPVLGQMDATDSFSITLYHWLRQLSAPIAPLRLKALLHQTWQIPSPPRTSVKSQTSIEENVSDELLSDDNATSLQVNSGLLKDSDSRLYALLYQNKAAEPGQKALFRCFQAMPNRFAPSTLPLVVDSEGLASLPGKKGFDQNLASSLLSDIYNTNVAAQDSLAAAKLIQASALRAYRSTREKLFLAQTDLESLTTRLRTVSDPAEREKLGKEIDWRNNRITYQQNEQKTQLKAISLAQTAINNSTSAAVQSFECGSKLFQLARGGIDIVENLPVTAGQRAVPKAYLLSKRYIFSPICESLQETEVFAEAAKAFNAESTPSTNLKSPWLAKKCDVFGPLGRFSDKPDTQILVQGRSLSDLKAEYAPTARAEPVVVVLTPHMLAEGDSSAPLFFRFYPFKGLTIPENQLLYYCQNGYRTGAPTEASGENGECKSDSKKDNRVTWSILARDLVANRGISSTHQYLGLPLQPAMSGWCKKAINNKNATDEISEIHESTGEGECPGLAAEWQLRSPLMIVDDKTATVLKGTTLSDPVSGQRVLQIPPVSPDQM